MIRAVVWLRGGLWSLDPTWTWLVLPGEVPAGSVVGPGSGASAVPVSYPGDVRGTPQAVEHGTKGALRPSNGKVNRPGKDPTSALVGHPWSRSPASSPLGYGLVLIKVRPDLTRSTGMSSSQSPDGSAVLLPSLMRGFFRPPGDKTQTVGNKTQTRSEHFSGPNLLSLEINWTRGPMEWRP
jgi:hypothetical protein